MSSTTKAQYHHGDLAPLIMELAVEEIASSGTEHLSLRSLARKAGVSQAAPYHHFSNKTGLLAALATKGFNDLRERLSAAQALSSSTGTQLLEMGVAYVEFTIENPVVYEIMFGQSFADFSDQNELHEAAYKCLLELQDCLKRLVKEKQVTINQQKLMGVLWSAVHGVASLQIRARPTNNSVLKLGINKAVAKDIRGSLEILLADLIR